MAAQTRTLGKTSPTAETKARRWAVAWNIARLVIAIAITAATIDQVRLATSAAASVGIDGATAVLRLLGFFTVQSNVLAAAVLVWAAVRALAARNRTADPPVLAVSLAAVTTYMLITGLVYNIVLRGVGDIGIMLGWSNDMHHIIGPAFMLLDLIIGSGRRTLRWQALLGVLAYPLAWVAVALALGPFLISPSTGTTPWYPYPFLDPTSTTGGYLGVTVWMIGIAVVIAALGSLTILAGRARGALAARRA